MVRLIHGAKADGEDFEMSPRIQAYFQDRISFNQEQAPPISGVFCLWDDG